MQGTLSLADITKRRQPKQTMGSLTLDDLLAAPAAPATPVMPADPFTGSSGSTLSGAPTSPEFGLTPPEPNQDGFGMPFDFSGSPAPRPMSQYDMSSLAPLWENAPQQSGLELFAQQANDPAAQKFRSLGRKPQYRGRFSQIQPDSRPWTGDDQKQLESITKISPDKPLYEPYDWAGLENDPRATLDVNDPNRAAYERQLVRQKQLIDTNDFRRRAWLDKGLHGEWGEKDWDAYGQRLPYPMDKAIWDDPELRKKYQRLNELAIGEPIMERVPSKADPLDRVAAIYDEREKMKAAGVADPYEWLMREESMKRGDVGLAYRMAADFGQGLVDSVGAVVDAVTEDTQGTQTRQYQQGWNQLAEQETNKRFSAIPGIADLAQKTVGSLGGNALAMTAGALSGNPLVTYGLLGIQAGATSYGAKRAEGWSKGDAFKYGLGSAAVEIGSELAGGKFAKMFGLETAEEAAAGLKDLAENAMAKALRRGATSEAAQAAAEAAARKAVPSIFAEIKNPIIRDAVERIGGSVIEGFEELGALAGGDVLDAMFGLSTTNAEDPGETFLIGLLTGGAMHLPHFVGFIADPNNWLKKPGTLAPAGQAPKESPFKDDVGAEAAANVVRDMAVAQNPDLDSQLPPAPPIVPRTPTPEAPATSPERQRSEALAWKIASHLGASREGFDSMVKNLDPQTEEDWQLILRPFREAGRKRAELARDARNRKSEYDGVQVITPATPEQIAQLRKQGFRGNSLDGLTQGEFARIQAEKWTPARLREYRRQNPAQRGAAPAPAAAPEGLVTPPPAPLAPQSPAAPVPDAGNPPADVGTGPGAGSVQPSPYEGRRVKPTDYDVERGRQWLDNAIARSPEGGPEATAAWLRKGFPDDYYWRLLQKTGQTLEEYIAGQPASQNNQPGLQKPAPLSQQPTQPAAIPTAPVAESPSPERIDQAVGGLAGTLTANYYAGLAKSIDERGEVPSAEQASNVGKLWDRVGRGRMTGQQFADELQQAQPGTADDFRALAAKLREKYQPAATPAPAPAAPTDDAHAQDAATLQRAFDAALPESGVRIEPNRERGAGNFRAILESGAKIDVQVRSAIPVKDSSWPRVLADYGLEDTPANRETLAKGARGSFALATGENMDTLGVIRIRAGLGQDTPNTIRHEMVHFLRQAKLIGDPLWKILVRKYADGETDPKRQEELIATAIGKPDEYQLRSNLRKIVDAFLAMVGITPSDADKIEQLIRSGRIFQAPKEPESKGKRSLGKPPKKPQPKEQQKPAQSTAEPLVVVNLDQASAALQDQDSIKVREVVYRLENLGPGKGWVVRVPVGSGVTVTHGGDPRGGGYSRAEAVEKLLDELQFKLPRTKSATAAEPAAKPFDQLTPEEKIAAVERQMMEDAGETAAPPQPAVAPKPEKRSLKPPQQTPTIADRAEAAQEKFKQTAQEWMDALKNAGFMSIVPGGAPLDPKLVKLTARLAVDAVEAGTLTFAAFVDRAVGLVGPAVAAKVSDYLDRAWAAAGKLYGDRIDAAGSSLDLIGGTNGTQPQADTAELRPGGRANDGDARRGDLAQEPSQAGGQSAESGNAASGNASDSEGLDADGQRPAEAGPAVPAGEQRSNAGARGSSGSRGGRGGRSGPSAGNVKQGATKVGGGNTFKKKSRYRDNVAAIRLVKLLASEGRYATPDEQQILIKYVGWGGLKEVFAPKPRDQWKAEAKEIKELLSPDEYKAASKSTQNAHFTDPDVIRAMWDGLRGFGFRGGSIMEPAMGTGLFFANMPDDIADNTSTRLAGVERDKITGQIAQQLHQAAGISIAPFQDVDVHDGSIDLFISNVPFAKVTVYDSRDPGLKQGQSVHDFFFTKAIKKTRPGGLVAFITSHDSLDETNSTDRKLWQQMGGDLVGAIRLPGGAFKGMADTAVVTDILVFQKRAPGAKPGGQPFMSVVDHKQTGYWGFPEDGRQRQWFPGETTFRVNEYFAANPGHVIGDLAWTGTMRKKGTFNVEQGDRDIPAEIRRIFGEIAGNVDKQLLADGGVLEDMQTGVIDQLEADWPHDHLKVEGDNRVFINRNGERVEIPAPYAPHEKTTKAVDVEQYDDEGNLVGVVKKDVETIKSIAPMRTGDAARLRGLISVFEAAERLVALQPDPTATDEVVEDARRQLNEAYDAFVAKHKPIGHTYNQTFAQMSLSMASRLNSIVSYDPVKQTETKTAIFHERTQRPYVPPSKADTPEQALLYSLANRGGIDFDYIHSLTGRDAADVLADLGPRVYKNPATESWESAETYLAGNVRAKLEEAKKAAASSGEYSRNVEALEKVQPEDVPMSQITARIGSTWIPESDYSAFYEDTFAKLYTFTRSRFDNQWTVTSDKRNGPVTDKEQFELGTERRPAIDLFERMLNSRDITVYSSVSGGGRYVNEDQTAVANAKAEALQQRFTEWLWEDTDRAVRLNRLYNDKMNVMRDVEFDGSHLQFPGMSEAWRKLFNSHQRNAVWRYLMTGNMLLGHVVGAGKTATLAAMAMEAKRLSGNKHYRTLLTAPRHLVTSGQIVKEILEVYPSAKVLAATPDSLSGQGRRAFLKRIAAENFDIIVMAHTSFQRIPLAPEIEAEFVGRELQKLEDDIHEAEANKGTDRNYIADLEASLERLEEKLKNLGDMAHRDENSVYFDELGINALFVDEAHMFKNLQVRTKLSRVPGVSTAYSARAFDMWMKTAYFNKLSNYRGVVLATGTPIANAVGELYVMQQYLQPQQLEAMGSESFDAWVANFASRENKAEMDPAGTGMRMNARLARYINLPELMTMFRQVADIRLFQDLKKILNRPEMETGKPIRVDVGRNPYLEAFMEQLQHRARSVRSGAVDPAEDNMLSIGTDGRRAALDIRLVDPTAPDLADSKINVAVRNVYGIWKETAAKKLTQLVWMDATSPVDKGPDDIDLYREFVDKLVDMGVPRDQVAIIHDFNEKTQKSLFAKVNAGEIRVLLGSTEKMGTGTNVQRLLVANHHLDVPHRPDQNEQRDGRALRRGNTNDTVRIIRYVAKGSFDAISWDRIERKTSFINQALSGRSARVVEELGEDLSAAEMKAAAADDPRMLEYVEVNAAYQKLKAERRAYIDETGALQSAIGTREFWRNQNWNLAKAERAAVAQYAAEVADIPEGEVRARLDDQEFTDAKEFGKALVEWVGAKLDEAREAQRLKSSPYLEWLEVSGPRLIYNGLSGTLKKITYRNRAYEGARINWLGKENYQFAASEISESAAGTAQRIANAVRATLENNGTSQQDEGDKMASDAEALRERVSRRGPFPKADELATVAARRKKLFDETHRDVEMERRVAAIYQQRTGREIAKSEDGNWVSLDNDALDREALRQAENTASEEKMQRRVAELERLKKAAIPYNWKSDRPQRVYGKAKKRAPKAKRSLGGTSSADSIVAPGPSAASQPRQPKAATTPTAILRGIPAPELFQLARDLQGGKTVLVRRLGQSLGRMQAAEGAPETRRILLNAVAGENENQLAATLAHEIGHVVDYLPEATLKRGNILGRIASLKKFVRPYLAGVGRNVSIRNELMELSKWWRGDWKDQPKDYQSYRRSSKELYADAISVLLNTPGELEERAPQFWRGLMDHFNKKPEVLRAYLNAQQMLAGTPQELAERRTEFVRNMFAESNEVVRAAVASQQAAAKSVVESLKQVLETTLQYGSEKAAPLRLRMKQAQKAGYKPGDWGNAYYLVDELNNIDSANHTMLARIQRNVLDPLEPQGLSLFDLEEYLFHRRIAYERTDKINPGGFTPSTSREQLDAMQQRLGAAKFQRLEGAAGIWHDIVYERTLEAVDAGVYNAERHQKTIEPNKDNYATFAVTHYLESNPHVTAALGTQVGTASDIHSTVHATHMKLVTLNRLIALNRAKRALRNFLKQNFPSEITKVPLPYKADKPATPAPAGMEHMLLLEDGKLEAYAIPKSIALMFNHHDIGRIAQFGRLIQSEVYGVFHPLFVTFNPNFQVQNPIRDLRRSYVNLGTIGHSLHEDMVARLKAKGKSEKEARAAAKSQKITLGNVLWAYWKAAPAAWKRAAGISDATIDRMMDENALDVPFVQVDPTTISDEGMTGYLMGRYGLAESAELPNPSKIRRGLRVAVEKAADATKYVMGPAGFQGAKDGMPAGLARTATRALLDPAIAKIENAVEAVGVFQETISKVAGYRLLAERGVPQRKRAFIVRKQVGTPDVRQRGLATDLTNSVRMYHKVKINGAQWDANLALDPSTAAGWWWRRMATSLLPVTFTKLAAYGLLGAGMKALLDAIPNYYQENYDLMLLGLLFGGDDDDEKGKAAFITVADDDTGKFLRRAWSLLLDGIAQQMGVDTRRKYAGETAQELGKLLLGEVAGTPNPILNLAWRWGQYAVGVNPTDSYYQAPIVPHREWQAGGMAATKKMLAWTADQFGVLSTLGHAVTGPVLGQAFESGAETPVEHTLRSLPGVSRFIRISDRGYSERQWAEIKAEEREAARFKVGLPESANKAVRDLYTLRSRDDLSLKEWHRMNTLSAWYSRFYLPVTTAMKAGEGNVERQRKSLDMTADEIQAAAEPLAAAKYVGAAMLSIGLPEKSKQESDSKFALRKQAWEQFRLRSEEWLFANRDSEAAKTAVANATAAFVKLIDSDMPESATGATAWAEKMRRAAAFRQRWSAAPKAARSLGR